MADVEDEYHLLFIRDAYDKLRKEYIPQKYLRHATRESLMRILSSKDGSVHVQLVVSYNTFIVVREGLVSPDN